MWSWILGLKIDFFKIIFFINTPASKHDIEIEIFNHGETINIYEVKFLE